MFALLEVVQACRSLLLPTVAESSGKNRSQLTKQTYLYRSRVSYKYSRQTDGSSGSRRPPSSGSGFQCPEHVQPRNRSNSRPQAD